MGTKEAYKQKIDAELELAHAKLNELKAKAKNATADARLQYEKQVGELEKKIDETKIKLKELTAAGEDAWEHIKHDVEGMWGRVSAAVKDAAAKIKS